MARKNSTFAERNAERISNGEVPKVAEAPKPEPNELDKPEVQAAILRPAKVTIPLEGSSIDLPTDITIRQSFERSTLQTIEALRFVLLKSVIELSGDQNLENEGQWFIRNGSLIPMVVYKDAVKNVVADFIGLMAQKPASEFRDLITSNTVKAVFMLALQILTDKAKAAGASDSKNATA